jgi:EmrB/QacA subfamily drug resistance transporter
MATLDISVVNIALPTLSRAFRTPLTTIEWVVLAYVATITGLLLVFGRLADARGRRRTYALGLLAFSGASALCAAAPGAAALIAARALQGVGAALMMSNSAALLVGSFPEAERGKALGAFGALVGVGLALGPPLGGLIVATMSWRWIFLLNLPIGILALALVRSRIPADGPPKTGERVDVLGAALWFATLVLLLLALSRGPVAGWGNGGVLAIFAASAVALVAFISRERSLPSPLLPPELFAGRLGVAALLTLLGQAISISVGFHLPLYFEDVLGFDAARSGRWLAMLPLAALFMAPVAGRLADRSNPKVLSVSGLVVAAAGFVLLAGLGIRAQPARLLAGMALVGFGLGLFTVPNTSALLGSVPASRLGIASGIQATMRNLGISAGAAATAAILASRFTAHGGGTLASGQLGVAQRAAFALSTRDVYTALAALALAGALLAGLAPGTPAATRGRA